MSWRDFEKIFSIADVEPGTVGGTFTAILPVPMCIAGKLSSESGANPIRISAVTPNGGSRDHFDIVQIFVADNPQLRNEDGVKEFSASMLPPTCDVGELVAIYVRNTSKEKRTFQGKIVGKEKVDR